MPLVHPAFNSIFRCDYPKFKLTDLRHDITDATVYTFTNCNVDLGGTGPSGIFQHHQNNTGHVSPNQGFVEVNIHSQDALADFGVSGVTLGGVAGQENSDRNGATNAINSAQYSWELATLSGITNTDIVVTHTEAVTGCTIAVMRVSNVAYNSAAAGNSSTGTGQFICDTFEGIDAHLLHSFVIGASTCASLTEQLTFVTEGGGHLWPDLLYCGNNAQFSFAGWSLVIPQYLGSQGNRYSVDWSGTPVADYAHTIWV